VQIQMSFLEAPLEKAGEKVWPTLEQARRDEVVAALARLIARAAEANKVGDEEARDD